MKSLSSGEIAKYCDVSLRTVIRWLDSGKLKGYKLPGRGNNRVRAEDFVAFLHDYGIPVPAEFQQAKQKALIVDDEADMAKAIQRVMRRIGLETQMAADGFQAGAMLATFQPALMTLDLSMPGLNGFDVLDYTRNSNQFGNLKILVISALGQAQLSKALNSGADAVLAKPFSNQELQDKVSQLLALSS